MFFSRIYGALVAKGYARDRKRIYRKLCVERKRLVARAGEGGGCVIRACVGSLVVGVTYAYAIGNDARNGYGVLLPVEIEVCVGKRDSRNFRFGNFFLSVVGRGVRRLVAGDERQSQQHG